MLQLLQALRTALSSLAAHSLRSGLTMLGMIFGVAAVIAMLAIGAGAEQEALAGIERLGVRNLLVRAKEMKDNELRETRQKSLGVSPRDIEAIEEAVPGVDLFAIRFLGGELLYYRRDDAVLMRRKRVVDFVLDLSGEMRFAPRAGEGQLWSHVSAFLLRLAEDLGRLFEGASLGIRVFFKGLESVPGMEKESKLLHFLLEKSLKAGTVELTTALWL